MRVPISWLKEYVEIDLPVEELAEKLTIAGLEVSEIDYVGVPGGDGDDRLVWDRERLILGQILKVEEHPNADRLVLATVDYGADEPETVVTGAPNLFPLLGEGDISERQLYSPFALEGAVVYDGHKEEPTKMTLKGRELRGIYNRSMVLSEKELGLSEEHEGVMILEGDYKAGTPLQELLGDVVLEIDIIPNIARAASILGVAREVAALTGKELRPPSFELQQEGPPIEGRVTISTQRPDLNPRFVALVIEGVEQKPSPFWMQHRLRLAGQRPINVVVDVSNYVMLEIGEPNHAFDYDFLRRRADEYNPDGPIHILTRLPEEGETVTTLDGVERTLPPFTILVADPAGPLSIGGIMGGEESEIGPGTTTVLLEAAAWNFINIRRSMHALRLNTEAGFRFSRGVHPHQAILGAKRAAELLRRLAGGTVWEGIVDYYPNPPEEKQIALTAAEVARIGGIDVSQAAIKKMLEALEFIVEARDDHLLVTPPDHRLDIEGSHDLVEEVCRVYGYDRIPEEEMSDTLPPQRNNPDLALEEEIRDILVQMGLQEVITYRLTTPARETIIFPLGSDVPPDDRPYVTLSNPITVERVAMRHNLLVSVLEVAAENSRFKEHIALFEVGPIYIAAEEGPLPDELRRLAVVLSGPRAQTHWANGDAAESYDFYDLKGIVEGLLAALRIEAVQFEAGRHPTFRPGRTARLLVGGRQVGLLGELHPLVVERLEMRTDHPVLAADLDVEQLLAIVPARHRVEPLPAYPAVHEDLALIVDADIPAAQVEAAIHKAGGFLLKSVELFDVYQGESIPAGKKSLAYHLSFQSPSKTLTDREIKRQRKRLLKALERQLGARLRE
ncbi:MAG: phenylalanine--tRNA ligase subunit beta [Candidatus Promineifilaceae bacterium]|nr:phenylalanine--tRNA ligase subunit beta [Candidatus Promineifilaceae bacterium]